MIAYGRGWGSGSDKSGDINTRLLLHFDGSYDDSSNAKVPVEGSPVSDKFVEGMFGQGLDLANNLPIYPIYLNSKDFTIEFFAKEAVQRGGDWAGIFGSYNYASNTDSGIALRYHSGTSYGLLAYLKNNGTEYSSGWLGRLPNTWVHVAMVLIGGQFAMYLAGVKIFNATGWSYGGMSGLHLGRWTLSNIDANGIHIDELRISNIARYTANFTPPTSPFR
ncbi:LamG-like jellyroll fold domain-containing protein [Massilibacteroides sp.]|uniref:LamG-like jellyroll fold domain-containing protein n=1 Tax=Massilibacteroides sp. TaxID=2034766 RepID=UPI00260AFC06|nr:LamG-like jellyroll fold domain-containing protein [Massilibacteroides sp.]MDD4515108.1 hypothetical protein [Massilibacteroides sp.]